MEESPTRLGLIDEDDIVLDEAALSLALLDHPGVDPQPYEALLTAVATRLELAGSDASTVHARADALSHVLCGEFGFIGDEKTYDDPANADLADVIDRRRGLPVSLSILYVAAARRMGWTANVLNVPGHVLVLVSDEFDSIIVDPFKGGVALGTDQLTALLSAVSTNHGTAAVARVARMTNRAVLVRLLLNQATRAEQTGKGRRALELYGRMTALAPSYGSAWWERARLELADGDVPAARQSLTAMLEITREPKLRRKVMQTLSAIVVP